MANRISIFFNGLPEFETMFRIAERLQARGRLEPVCFAPTQVLRREPRLRAMIAQSGLNFTFRPNRFFKLFPGRYVRRADSNLCLVDPLIDYGANFRRSSAIRKLGQKSVFLQHGVLQAALNFKNEYFELPYYSSRILTFEDILDPAVLLDSDKEKLRIVGFIKTQLFPPRPPKTALPAHNRVVLFCHSFRWSKRYSQEEMDNFFQMVRDYADRNPEDLVILRGHRAKIRSVDKDQMYAFDDKENVIVSHDHSGPLKRMSITDVLGLCDFCVTSASTAALDSVYMGKPTALYEKEQQIYPHLQKVTDIETLEAFVSTPDQTGLQATIAHYGQLKDNIERACEEIEDVLTSN